MSLQSPWSLLQVLSSHTNPERCLVIGKVGTRTYESAAALGRQPEVVEPEEVHKMTSGGSAGRTYDLVVVVERHLEKGAITNELLCRMLSSRGVGMRIRTTGKMAALHALFSRKRQTEGYSASSRPSSVGQAPSIKDCLPQDRYLLLGAQSWKNSAVASEQSLAALSNAIIGDERNLQVSLRKLSLRMMMTAGLPAEGLFPKSLVIYRKRKKSDEQTPFISRARVTG